MDGLTGLALFFVPVFAMRLLGVQIEDSNHFAITMLRFVGSFVGSIGWAYLLPFIKQPVSEDEIVWVWKYTAFFRVLAGASVAFFVISGALPINWALITLTDWSVAVLQMSWLKGIRK